MLKIKNLSSGSYLLSQRQAYILYISTCNYYTAVSIQVQYSHRVLTDGVYVSGSSIVDTRRGYDEVFNTKLHYNMPGLYTLMSPLLSVWGELQMQSVFVHCIYMYRPMALVMCSTCIMLRTPRVLGHGYVPLMDPRALDAG